MGKTTVAVLAALAAVLCTSQSAPGQLAGAPSLRLEEAPVGKLLASADLNSIVVSADLQHIAYVAQRDEKPCVVAAGVAGRPYDRVYGLAISPDGKHVAHAGVRDATTVLVYDGVERKEVEGTLEITFSPDSQRLAYTVSRSFAGQTPDKAAPRRKARAVVEGMEGREYDWVGHLTFSPDSRRVAYTAVTDQRAVVVADGIEGTPFDGSVEHPGGHPAFGGGKFAYAPQRRKRTPFRTLLREAGMADDYRARAVIGSIEGKEYAAVHSITLSPDGRRFAYVAGRLSARDRKERAVVDGLENREYDEVRSLTFSANGRHVAYVARRERGSVVVVGGAERYAFEKVGDPVFAPEGQHLAFWAGMGVDWFLVVDGVQVGRYDCPVTNALAFPSPDSVNALARRGDEVIRVNVRIQGPSGR